MRSIALRCLLFASVAGSVAVLGLVVADEVHKPALRFAEQVAAGAQKLYESGQRETAISALEEVLQRTPDSIVARRELAMQLAASGQWSAAAEELRRILKLTPRDAGAARKLAEALEQTGDTKSAVEYARLACGLDSENGVYWMELAALLLRAGEADEAVGAAQRAVRYADGVPKAHILLGSARLRAGDLEGARRALADALALDPDNREALEALARIGEPGRPRARVPQASACAGQAKACATGGRSTPFKSARLISDQLGTME